MKIYRHGDVLLKEVTKIPAKAKDLKTNLVEQGTANGNHHHFSGGQAITRQLADKKYIDVLKISPLSHEEHDTIKIAKGKYEVIHEREFDYFENDMRRVID